MKGQKTGGRRKGTPNKATKDVRAAIALLAQNKIGELEEWLDRTAKKNPAMAAKILLETIEYHIPKLSRSELTGKDGKELPREVIFQIHGGK
jgi:hypothetical protein